MAEGRDAKRSSFTFEVGPIRPPSEARSLLVRVTRNCPWNKCTFCPVYKKRKFSRRAVAEVEADIEAMGRAAEHLKEVSWRLGSGGSITPRVVQEAMHGSPDGDYLGQIGLWLMAGGRTVFLQDANSLVIPAAQLVAILRKLRETFPLIDRITSYARSQTLARMKDEDLRALAEAGLNRIHVGMESGSDAVLARVRKGATRAQHIEGGRKVIEAGMELSEYVMPGLGGVDLSDEHADDTAAALNQIDPHFIRLRTLGLRSGTGIRAEFEQAAFTPLGEDEIVREIRRLVAGLEGIRSTIVSDHILNLLEEVEGRLPGDKQRLLDLIDRYLALPDDDRLAFQIGRRMGALRSPDELDQPGVHDRLAPAVAQIREQPGGADAVLRELITRFI